MQKDVVADFGHVVSTRMCIAIFYPTDDYSWHANT